MFYYMYQIKNLMNNKIYVGVHKTKSLGDGYMGSGKIIRSAITKHGISNFSKVILEFFENQEAMYAKEKEVVNDEFLLREDVYNLRCIGYGGFDHINKNMTKEEYFRRGKLGQIPGITKTWGDNPNFKVMHAKGIATRKSKGDKFTEAARLAAVSPNFRVMPG